MCLNTTCPKNKKDCHNLDNIWYGWTLVDGKFYCKNYQPKTELDGILNDNEDFKGIFESIFRKGKMRD